MTARIDLVGRSGARRPVDLAGLQQVNDGSDQLPGGEYEGPAVLMPGNLMKLLLVVGTELGTLETD